MARDKAKILMSLRCLCSIVFLLSALSIISFFSWCNCNGPCYIRNGLVSQNQSHSIDLVTYPSAWNHLSFPETPPPRLLKIAAFVKKWPHRSHAGGLERHALTLHLALARRGHELHIFTASSPNFSLPKYPMPNLHFHLSKPTAAGYLDQAIIWKQFQVQNTSGKPFDVVHTESVALMHTRARNVTNLVVSWHGIAYETIHSDIIQELLTSPDDKQSHALSERLIKVVEEVKFFKNYAHHVATSDHVGDVLKRVYMIPEERVHVILNGVDENIFKPSIVSSVDFKRKYGIPGSKSVIIGLAGRLVKDKGHPLMFEALKQLLSENADFRRDVLVLVAGDGPWGARYQDLKSNALVLGPLEQTQLARFYDAIDIFANPTLRAQGLDHTLLEAMLSGKPVLATRLASITGSVVVNADMGYTFPPTVDSLKKALHQVWNDKGGALQKKGLIARKRGLHLFAATKMAAAYERLFLCIASEVGNKDNYCRHKEQFG